MQSKPHTNQATPRVKPMPCNTAPFRRSSLTSGKAPEIPECYKDLAKVFSETEPTKLPPHRGHLDHHIRLEDGAKPVYGPIYNLSELELKVLKSYLAEKMKMGFIRPSTSPYGSPSYLTRSRMAASAYASTTAH